MKDLREYDNTTVRIVTDFGETFTGACEWFPPEYGFDTFGNDEEGLKIEDYYVFASQIEDIEVLRGEVCIPVRGWLEAKDEIAEWFHERWGIPLETYRQSILDCLDNEDSTPQWYVVVRGHKIIAGCGVIENDFHERTDLAPNVCAVYVDPEYRGQGVAGFMLDFVCDDMAKIGFPMLYLLTDHTGFYERYGWQYLCDAKTNDGDLSRVYVHQA